MAATVNWGRTESCNLDVENLRNGAKYEIGTWDTCNDFEECFEMLGNSDVTKLERSNSYPQWTPDRCNTKSDFVVAFESVALHQFRKKP